MPVLTPHIPACASQDGSLCQRIWDSFGVGWLAANADTIAWTALRIVLIVVIAVIARAIAHRAIRRLTRVTTDGRLPPLLRSLRERTEARLLGARLSQRRQQRADTISSVLRSLVSVVVFTIAIILILGELGIDLAPILASAGIVGFAVGFGAQNLVKDFISGIFMMLEDQYGVGDRVDLGAASGTVMAVSFRVTTVRAEDTGDLWYVRNGEITRVGNASQGAELPPVTTDDQQTDDQQAPTDSPDGPAETGDIRDIHISGDVHIAGGITLAGDAGTTVTAGGTTAGSGPAADRRAGDTSGDETSDDPSDRSGGKPS